MDVGLTARFVLRLPADLHQRLRQEAARAGVSLNSLCVSALDHATRPPPATGNWTPWVETAKSLFGSELEGVLIFGSVARGEQREDSDVDLLVVLSRAVTVRRSLYRAWDEAHPDTERVNPHFVHLPDPDGRTGSLWIEVALDGVVLHDPNANLARHLSRLRRALASGVVRAGTAHGQRYWVHTVQEPRRA